MQEENVFGTKPSSPRDCCQAATYHMVGREQRFNVPILCNLSGGGISMDEFTYLDLGCRHDAQNHPCVQARLAYLLCNPNKP